MSISSKGTAGRSQLRIIGGQWRGRKLIFTPEPGLRPTTDRIRETLFNWLAADIHGARCLDLFAGSGALGLEALSRGAAFCEFVDTSPAVLKQISHHLSTLAAQSNAACHRQPAQQFLESASKPWDIAFIDPPFGENLVEPCCAYLAANKLLAQGALVYVEVGANEDSAKFPADWQLHREKKSGGVRYQLFIVGP